MRTIAFLTLAALLLLAPGHASAEPPERCDDPIGQFENCPPGALGGPARAEVCGHVVTGTFFPL